MTIYAIHANGTFWGPFEGQTEADAIQAAADEHGTDGNTDGLTARPMDSYLLDVARDCAENGCNFSDLVKEFFNCREGEIDESGDIWISDPQSGHWIDSEKKADLIAWIEAR